MARERKKMALTEFLQNDYVKARIEDWKSPSIDYVKLINNYGNNAIGRLINEKDIEEQIKKIDKDFLALLMLACEDDCYYRFY